MIKHPILLSPAEAAEFVQLEKNPGADIVRFQELCLKYREAHLNSLPLKERREYLEEEERHREKANWEQGYEYKKKEV